MGSEASRLDLSPEDREALPVADPYRGAVTHLGRQLLPTFLPALPDSVSWSLPQLVDNLLEALSGTGSRAFTLCLEASCPHTALGSPPPPALPLPATLPEPQAAAAECQGLEGFSLPNALNLFVSVLQSV